jgi:hypothetical protein
LICGVDKKRSSLISRVELAGDVGRERKRPSCRIVYAGGIADERIRTVGRVLAAGCVAQKCMMTASRVIAAGCVARQNATTDGRVGVVLGFTDVLRNLRGEVLEIFSLVRIKSRSVGTREPAGYRREFLISWRIFT